MYVCVRERKIHQGGETKRDGEGETERERQREREREREREEGREREEYREKGNVENHRWWNERRNRERRPPNDDLNWSSSTVCLCCGI